MTSFVSHAVKVIQGDLCPPGDKSISHRALLLSAMADGHSRLSHFLKADDCLRTLQALRQMGVSVEAVGDQMMVRGVGLHGLKAPAEALDLGNSGTSLRLLLGFLAAQHFETTLSGDASLIRRPMRRVTRPLRKMGALIVGRDDANFAPLKITGKRLNGISHLNDPASAQVKSAILLAGLSADSETSVEEPIRSRDHTERLLKEMGASIVCKENTIHICQTAALHPITFRIPGDISSATFFIVAAALLPGSALTVKEVGLNPTRIGILEILRSMGTRIDWTITTKTPEPVGIIHVYGSELHGTQIRGEMIPNVIDELPILMTACALASGRSVIRDAQELRVKETDRIRAMAAGLNAIGAHVDETDDGCIIDGMTQFHGGEVSSFGDHRTAMSLIVGGLKSSRGVCVNDTACIDTSYPSFFDDLKLLTKSS